MQAKLMRQNRLFSYTQIAQNKSTFEENYTMNTSTKIIASVINFFFLYWFFFSLQSLMVIGVEVKFLNAGVALFAAAILTYIIWRQQLNFNTMLKFSGIFWLIGFILGIAYVSIFDPHEAQGIFLCIFWTAPYGWILGMILSVFRAKRAISISNQNDPQQKL